MHIILLGLSLLLSQQEGGPQLSFPARPPEGTYVVDEAGLIDADQRRVISSIAADQMRLQRGWRRGLQRRVLRWRRSNRSVVAW